MSMVMAVARTAQNGLQCLKQEHEDILTKKNDAVETQRQQVPYRCNMIIAFAELQPSLLRKINSFYSWWVRKSQDVCQ